MTDIAQPSLFDPPPQAPTPETARARRDAGMALAGAHAGDAWRKYALRWVRTYAAGHEHFHVDEFWAWALARGFDEGDSPRALGTVIQDARRAGLISRTRISAPSVRSNMSPKPVWRSETYTGQRTGLFRGGPVV